uniref:(northern house mosquito) hypothetical protein n=1 Tax=Culex pipiens TaxID=7175 RepID=A0A8D8GAZ2_CULPI
MRCGFRRVLRWVRLRRKLLPEVVGLLVPVVVSSCMVPRVGRSSMWTSFVPTEACWISHSWTIRWSWPWEGRKWRLVDRSRTVTTTVITTRWCPGSTTISVAMDRNNRHHHPNISRCVRPAVPNRCQSSTRCGGKTSRRHRIQSWWIEPFRCPVSSWKLTRSSRRHLEVGAIPAR